MKDLFSIFFFAMMITFIVFACVSEDIHVQHRKAELIRKELKQQVTGDIIRQYWLDLDRKIIYWEDLPIGDTGWPLGVKTFVLIAR